MEIKLAALIGGAIILTAGALTMANRGPSASEQAPPIVAQAAAEQSNIEGSTMSDSMDSGTREEAKEKLTAEQYNVCVLGGTEKPFDNKYYNYHEDGTYTCAVCGTPLFKSDTKYNSGSGWPAFYAAIDEGRIVEMEDHSFGMDRIEVRCANCGAHLGHLFPDGPQPTGMRYCINSASLDFEPADKNAADADKADSQGSADNGGAASGDDSASDSE